MPSQTLQAPDKHVSGLRPDGSGNEVTIGVKIRKYYRAGLVMEECECIVMM